MDGVRGALNKTPLYEQVAQLLEHEIIARPPEEERLPSEQALAERFGVSRTIIREALKLLKERGLIDSRTGSGAYITKPEAHNLSDVMSRIIKLDGIAIPEIYDVRTILEVAAVKRAVHNASQEQLEQMERQLELLKDRTITVKERRDADFTFHYQIAEASANALLLLLVHTMSNVFKEIIMSGIYMMGGIDDAILRHQRIMDALKARDEAAAERAMQGHLKQSLVNAMNYQSARLDEGRIAREGAHEYTPNR